VFGVGGVFRFDLDLPQHRGIMKVVVMKVIVKSSEVRAAKAEGGNVRFSCTVRLANSMTMVLGHVIGDHYVNGSFYVVNLEAGG
jgi:hypothetical protein